MSAVDGLTSVPSPGAALAARPGTGRADWPDLPRRPPRTSRTGWLRPGREISQTARWALRALALLAPLVAWIGLSGSGAVAAAPSTPGNARRSDSRSS